MDIQSDEFCVIFSHDLPPWLWLWGVMFLTKHLNPRCKVGRSFNCLGLPARLPQEESKIISVENGPDKKLVGDSDDFRRATSTEVRKAPAVTVKHYV